MLSTHSKSLIFIGICVMMVFSASSEPNFGDKKINASFQQNSQIGITSHVFTDSSIVFSGIVKNIPGNLYLEKRRDFDGQSLETFNSSEDSYGVSYIEYADDHIWVWVDQIVNRGAGSVLMKIDHSNLEITKEYKNPKDQLVKDLIKTEEGELYALAANNNLNLYKFNENARVDWKIDSDLKNDNYHDIIDLEQGKVLLLGQENLKVYSNSGEVLWSKKVPNHGNDVFMVGDRIWIVLDKLGGPVRKNRVLKYSENRQLIENTTKNIPVGGQYASVETNTIVGAYQDVDRTKLLLLNQSGVIEKKELQQMSSDISFQDNHIFISTYTETPIEEGRFPETILTSQVHSIKIDNLATKPTENPVRFIKENLTRILDSIKELI